MASSEIAHLLKMANDIAANLSFQSNTDERIADHINRFWAPRMRDLLIEYAASNGEGLSAALLPAVKKLRKS
jgi:formate dehydrogenase subunit delta